METAVNRNESEFDRLKREALEWIKNPKSRLVPSFIKIAVETAQQAQPDKDLIIAKQEELTKTRTAILFILENPDREDFIMRNCRTTSVEGDDNSIDLSGYWREQNAIVTEHLRQLEQQLQTLKSK